MRTKLDDEDVLDNFCQSVYYLARILNLGSVVVKILNY
jgi:hypothetical protein